MKRVFVTSKSFGRSDGGAAVQRLIDHGFVVERSDVANPDRDDMIIGARDADVLLVGNDTVDTEVLDAASRLRLVMMNGTGLDAIDVEAASRRGILVANVAGVNRNSVAELIVALMLMGGRRIPQHIELLREGTWARSAGHELTGASVGVLGAGNIGQRVIELLQGFRCSIHIFDPALKRAGFAGQRASLHHDMDEVISLSDYLVLAMPLTEQTRHVINERTLGLMKPHAIVVNAARGGLIDEHALCDAVRNGTIGGAALDAFDTEPLPIDSELRDTDIILTPHMAATSVESSAQVSMAVADRIVDIMLNDRHELAVNYREAAMAQGGSIQQSARKDRKERSRKMITGSLVPNITIFDEDGALNLGKTKDHMRWMYDRGADGVFPTGSYGAGPLMTNEERISVYRAAREVADEFQGKQIVAHVGAVDARNAVELAKAAEQVGVDAVGAVPPFYYKYTDESVMAYYEALIQAVDVPVFAYNNPSTTRYTFTVPVVLKLMEAGLAGLKDSPLNVQFLSRLAYSAQQAGSDFQLILGTSTGWLPLHHMGIKAMFAGTNNWAPELTTELVRATTGGEQDRARDVYLVMEELSHKMHFTDSTIASHMALRTRGFDSGFPRAPMLLPSSSDPKYAEIDQFLRAAFDCLGIAFE